VAWHDFIRAPAEQCGDNTPADMKHGAFTKNWLALGFFEKHLK